MKVLVLLVLVAVSSVFTRRLGMQDDALFSHPHTQPADPESKMSLQPADPESKMSLQPADPESKMSLQPADPESKMSLQPADPESKMSLQPADPEPHVLSHPADPEPHVLSHPADPEPHVLSQPADPEPNMSQLFPELIKSTEHAVGELFKSESFTKKVIRFGRKILWDILQDARSSVPKTEL
nr:alpha carbonic anhydrase 8-like [Procambarus clarkii]